MPIIPNFACGITWSETMLKKFECWKYVLMDVDPWIFFFFYAAGPTYRSNSLVY